MAAAVVAVERTTCDRRGAKEVDATYEPREPFSGLARERRVGSGAILQRADHCRHQGGLHVLVVLEAPGGLNETSAASAATTSPQIVPSQRESSINGSISTARSTESKSP